MKFFRINKGRFENSDVVLIDDEEMITSDRISAKRFNEHYMLSLYYLQDLCWVST